ncbi:hypothetical protein Tco_0837545 [Tanacetum coccineum]
MLTTTITESWWLWVEAGKNQTHPAGANQTHPFVVLAAGGEEVTKVLGYEYWTDEPWRISLKTVILAVVSVGIDVVGIEVVVWRCGSGCDGVAAMAWWCAGGGGDESGPGNLAVKYERRQKIFREEEK